jgi:hypothetical protein
MSIQTKYILAHNARMSTNNLVNSNRTERTLGIAAVSGYEEGAGALSSALFFLPAAPSSPCSGPGPADPPAGRRIYGSQTSSIPRQIPGVQGTASPDILFPPYKELKANPATVEAKSRLKKSPENPTK